MLRPTAIAFAALALSLAGCSMVPGSQASSRPADRGASAANVGCSSAGQCLSRLGAEGAGFTPLPDRYLAQGCSNIGTVQLRSVAADMSSLPVANLGPVTCEVSRAFAAWARYGADRAARQILRQPLRSIETFGSYSCRNVASSGRRSAHATASAIDISAFVLQDGTRISVREDWDAGSQAERQFLRTVHQSACKRFATVLGPQYNAAHRDHLHLEGLISGRSYCR